MTKTSREYAEALFSLALEADQPEAFAEGLGTVEQALEENPGFLQLLSSPAIPREARMDALSQAFQEKIPFSELVLLRMMVSRGHARNMTEMIREYRDLQREQRGESEALVTSAVCQRGLHQFFRCFFRIIDGGKPFQLAFAHEAVQAV